MTTVQAKQVWQAVLGQLQLQVTRPSYQTWLKDTVGVACHDGEFVVGTPNVFVAEMLEQRMYSLISQAMQRVTRMSLEVRFRVLPKEDPADCLRVNQEGVRSNGSVEAEHQSSNGHSAGQSGSNGWPLNSRYTFETFIVGKSNELAHAASAAVSDRPGAVYNPLVIHSDVGLGKTHLLHAIGHKIRQAGLSLLYATTEEFTNEYIKAIRIGKTEDFRRRYRGTDVLMLDDIQFLFGKEQTQEGFFHTFNALHVANRQIVITSDRPIGALSLLEDRIRSRLAGGLVVDIQAPSVEMRLAILRAKADFIGWHIDPEVVQFLGERLHTNIRELEGGLTRLVAYAQLTGKSVNLDLARQVLADGHINPPTHRPSDRAVLEAVASQFQMSAQDLEGRRRDKKTSTARQVAMYLLREHVNLGPTAIGRILGGKDHTTVIHGCRRIENTLQHDPALRHEVGAIQQSLSRA